MSDFVYKLLGAVSGLILFWSVAPKIRGELSYVSLFMTVVIATVGARLTSGVLANYGPFNDSPESLFIAAALNGLALLPLARYLSAKAAPQPPTKKEGTDHEV